MSLADYQRKRRFEKTPEPRGKTAKRPGPEKPARGAAGKQLHFVIQQHDASRLHYDFRLEVAGVLKSWAVPRGPSTDPRERRLAMAVEDHPLDYADFEGVIGEGNYGAGTVMVWDRGTYTPLDHHTFRAPSLGQRSQEVTRQLNADALKIELRGRKLRGIYNLVRFRRPKMDNGWLLIKHPDSFVSRADVTRQDRSVKTGRSLAEIAAASK